MLKRKQIRKQNFPSEISENIVKFILFKRYGLMANWDCCGDLELNTRKIEVKCFSSKGPISFGPTEKWNSLFILDATKHMNNYFKLYFIDLPNTSSIWMSINVKKDETFQDQCDQKRRPRICFSALIKQLPKVHCKLIFKNDFNI